MMSMKKRMTEVCVLGGGAAGLMATISAAAAGARVLVLEREERCARKLRITGKGRCNVTNNCSVEQMLNNVTGNARFLFSVMNAFPPEQAMAFFEELGVPLKTERGSRVFPVSDRAEDVVQALLRRAAALGVEFLHARAGEILRGEDGCVCAVRAGEVQVDCDCVILCTGGLSYPKTGSSGDGYAMAQALGHSVTELRPSLVPLLSPDEDCAAMQGLSLKNVTLTLKNAKGKAVWSELGEMQFTHFGVTGPLVLSASAHMGKGGPWSLELDLKPGLDEQKLDARLLRMFAENQNRDFKNALDGLLPRLLEPVIIRRSGIPPETKVNAITRQQRAALLDSLKHFPIAVSGTRPIEEAVITAGGIRLKEVNPGTMASKLVEGLFFAGEILDLDAYTGGYNLQIAWATGRAAGKSAAAYAEGRRTQ